MSKMETIICNRCGEPIPKYKIGIEDLHKYDRSSIEAYIDSMVRISNVPYEVAKCRAHHGMYEQCEAKQRDCPYCGKQLKTWRAKMCLSCGATFSSLIDSNS